MTYSIVSKTSETGIISNTSSIVQKPYKYDKINIY